MDEGRTTNRHHRPHAGNDRAAFQTADPLGKIAHRCRGSRAPEHTADLDLPDDQAPSKNS